MEQSELCARCPEPAVMRDVLDFYWCEAHRHRGELINKGYALGWRRIAFDRHAIGPTLYNWVMPCVLDSNEDDEMLWLILGYIEHLEEQRSLSQIGLDLAIQQVEAQIQAGVLWDAVVVDVPEPDAGELAG